MRGLYGDHGVLIWASIEFCFLKAHASCTAGKSHNFRPAALKHCRPKLPPTKTFKIPKLEFGVKGFKGWELSFFWLRGFGA